MHLRILGLTLGGGNEGQTRARDTKPLEVEQWPRGLAAAFAPDSEQGKQIAALKKRHDNAKRYLRAGTGSASAANAILAEAKALMYTNGIDMSSGKMAQARAMAKRSSVQDIQMLARGMSVTECRSLAFHFAALGAPSACVSGEHALLAAKRAAAAAFTGCAKDWPKLMAPHVRYAPPSPPTKCRCRCGCDSMVYCQTQCSGVGCYRFVCDQCDTAESIPRCHVCRKVPKNTSVALKPSVALERGVRVSTQPINPLGWYFNDDWDIGWLRENRDVRLDPPLLDVLRVRKDRVLFADKRKVLPFDWELAFTLRCQLQDPIGGCAEVTINLKAFVQNPVWARHPMVEYIKTWLPSHFEFRGDLWKDRAAYVAPPSPRSPPYINETATWAESTVHIEEVDGQDAGSSSSMCIAPATKHRKL